MDVGFTLTVETKLLIITFYLNLGIDLNLISREIVTDGVHDLRKELVSQALTAEVGRGDDPTKGYQAGLLQKDPGIGGNLPIQFIIDMDCLEVIVVNIVVDPFLFDGENLIPQFVNFK